MDDDARQAVLEAERRRCEALESPDMAALDALFDPALIHVHSNGLVQDKASLLGHIENRGSGVRVERGELQVRMMGEAALLVGPITNRWTGPDGATRALGGVAMQVLRRSGAGWRFVGFQFTLTEAPPD